MPTFKDGVSSPFLPGTNKQFAWDSTSLSTFLECPRKYQLMMLEQIGAKENPTALRFGILFHSGLEHYDKLIVAGHDHDAAQHAMVKYLLEETWDERSEESPGHPWHSGLEPGTIDPYKNRDTLIRSCVWYTEHYIHDNLKTLVLRNGAAAIEFSFRLEIGNGLLWCGHLDKVADFQGNHYVLDRKTTKTTPGQYYFSQFDLSVQMSGYMLAGKLIFDTPIRGVFVDCAQVAVNFTRFERMPTMRSELMVEEFLAEVYTWVAKAHACADANEWPRNLTSCSKYSGCQYRKICAADPRIRDSIIKSDYVRKEWNPLEER